MRRSRAVASGIAILVAVATGCGPGAPDANQVYLETIRTVVPEAADVSDDTLLRMGAELCGAGEPDEETQRAIEILFGEVNRFGVAESDIVASAVGAAIGAFCPPSASAGPSDASSDPPTTDAPLPTLPAREELESAITATRDRLLAAIEAGVPLLEVDGVPAELSLAAASLDDGVLEIELRAADDDPAPDAVAYELSRQLAPFESQLASLGPVMAALIRGAPSLEMRVVVDAGEVEAVTLDAALIADLASGSATFEDWLARVTRETP